MRRTRLTTTLVAAAAVTFGLVSPVAMADDVPAPNQTSSVLSPGNDNGEAGKTGDTEDGNEKETENDKPDTIFGSSAEQTAKIENVMSWVSVIGGLLAGIVQATVMLAQINPAILNPLKDLLKQAGVKF